jgi:hypothetical protein
VGQRNTLIADKSWEIGGGTLQSTIATISTAGQLFPLPAGFLFSRNSNIYSFE